MESIFRKRTAFIWLLPLIVLAAMWLTDPDKGASTKVWLLHLVTAGCVVALAHWWEKGIFDYAEADRRTLFAAAGQTPEGAGRALVARAIFFLAMILAFSAHAGDADTRMPDRAPHFLPLLHAAQASNWPDHPRRELLPAQIEHESGCFSMPRKCWNPTSQLRSAREQGAGLGQITRAFRPDGRVRFDALADLRDRHPALRDWSWENVLQRPDLQLTAVVLQMRDGFLFFRHLGIAPPEAMRFALVGYNGGDGGVQSDRRACGLTPGCDPARWYGNVELHCTKSRVALYGQRSACDINRAYLPDIERRAPKYRGLV